MSDTMHSDDESARAALRDNARRVLQESHAAAVLQEMNRALLKGRGWFDEYDSGVIFKWGTGSTRRHIWVDIRGDDIRVRLREHRPCSPNATVAACDGEYHSYDRRLWSSLDLLKRELHAYYEHPVSESSED